ncbi:Ribosomal protein S6 [Dillenia turbinata]|uniref:Ribosomal protein S6 n=1 Tax=Dillenia turbinata TaxID=194707 RepID=A0AAN8UP61_9MAGN
MPLYDCMLLLKPTLKQEAILDLIARVGKHVFRRNGVVTEIKPLEKVQLGYGIRKLDGRYYQRRGTKGHGQLMQMTMMVPPSFNSELHYLSKEDRLLRWLLIKHRDIKYGLDFLSEDDGRRELSRFGRSSLYDKETDEDDDEDNEDVEYAGDQEEQKDP